MNDRTSSGAVFEVRRYPVPGGIAVTADVGGDPRHPAVILTHGGGQTRHSWHGAMRELIAQGYHVINLDARGHGDSDWSPDGVYSVELLSDDLKAVIATLPNAPALVGASMGGITSLHAVGTSDRRIASALILVDVVPRVEATGGAKIMAFMRARPEGFANLEEAADAVAAYNPHRPRPRVISGLMKNLRLREDGRLHWHWDPRFLSMDPPEPPIVTERLLEAAARVREPTLVVRGLQSDIVSEAGIEEFRRYLPTLEVFNVPGAGHMVAGDRNDAFNQGVTDFLRRHHPAR
ncbi:alpha/beta hydrolase [Hydrocarboniphaga effusa]|jgi:pimeloyl-ACP methyl ester carboxylesterase|uniref:alpha/beta fold hydrolase n=1 Tax=Hydrocarboniphaga effusa TaxID=243629 RepID=UPI00313806F4